MGQALTEEVRMMVEKWEPEAIINEMATAFKDEAARIFNSGVSSETVATSNKYNLLGSKLQDITKWL